MRYGLLLLMIMTLFSCDETNEKVYELNIEKHALESTIDSLRSEIAELTRPPDQLIRDIKNGINDGNLENAKLTLVAIISHQFTIAQRNEISKLLIAVNTKLEQADYQNLSETDTSLYSLFIKDHPKSKYAGQVSKRLNKLRRAQTISSSNNSGNLSSYRQNRKTTNYGTTRVGALCCDGTRSYATGRGACSHHGGVCQWLYR